MMTAAQTQAVKRNLLAAQVSYKRSELNEKSLYVELHNFFQHLKKTVLHELREYWKDDDSILLEGQLDLILAPIFESQQEYYNILRKHNIKEYNSGCREARRLVKLTRKNVSSHKSENNTIKTNNLLKLAVDKDELFGTNDWTQQRLLDQSFTASEGTMNRVDKDINKIISDGYASGAGINKVAANIETRFEQLKTWEAKRIARTEIHNAHQMGIMNTYYEMGVEYTQWSSAHDSRVRGLKPKDKADHVKMDGEIIPLGGTYSNGLQYPGDTKGPIYEWINCRCGNVPFIIPDGYIAPPGMAQFREKDLIQTLDYWNEAELIDSIMDYSSPVKGVEIREVPLDSNVMTHEFAISPSKEIMNEFDISKKGMDTIHQFQKDSFGSKIEIGIAFSENNGRIYTGKAIGTADGVTIRTPKKCSTIHNHTDKSFNPPSGDDFYTYLKNGKERIGINVSPKETWVMQHKNKTGLSNKKINKLADKVDELSYEYSQKFKKEYHTELDRINRTIKDPKLRQKELDKLKYKVNNEWLDKYNKELGDGILREASKFKGLKVKRFENVKINKKEVKDLPKLKKEKNNDILLRRSKQINNVQINKDKTEKVVEINGKKIYGIKETLKDQIAFGDKFAIKKSILTKKEFNFIKLYSDEGDAIINGYYREISKAKTKYKKDLIKLKYSLKWDTFLRKKDYYLTFNEALKISDSIFKKGIILDEDLVVVRRQWVPLLDYANFGIYHSDSLLSTTISKNVKPKEYGEYISYIVIPKGTKIFYIEGITDAPFDFEILFGRNKDLKFINYESEFISHWILM